MKIKITFPKQIYFLKLLPWTSKMQFGQLSSRSRSWSGGGGGVDDPMY